jgi:hypothetical protein
MSSAFWVQVTDIGRSPVAVGIGVARGIWGNRLVLVHISMVWVVIGYVDCCDFNDGLTDYLS